MTGILRGGIYWTDLNPVIGHEQARIRPVLILSQNIFNEKSGNVITVALTSQLQKAGYPLTYQLNDSKLLKTSWVKISQIRTLSTKKIGNKLSKISEDDLSQIIEGLNEIIGS